MEYLAITSTILFIAILIFIIYKLNKIISTFVKNGGLQKITVGEKDVLILRSKSILEAERLRKYLKKYTDKQINIIHISENSSIIKLTPTEDKGKTDVDTV